MTTIKILVLGGVGFFGSNMCQKYVKEGHKVICVDNLMNGNLSNVRNLMGNPNFKFVYGDIRDKELMYKLLQNVDVCYLLAAQIHVDRSLIEPELTYDINLKGVLTVLEAAKLCDVRIIYASTSECYGSAQTVPMSEEHPLNGDHPYSASKIAGERLCYSYAKTYGMNIAIARPFNTFGFFQKDSGYGGVIGIFTRRTLAGLPNIIYGDGEQRRDYLFISDALDAYDLLMKSKIVGQPINFGRGESFSINQISDLIIKVCGGKVKAVHVEARHNEVQNLVADISKAKRLLGWSPKISFEEGLKKYVDYVKNFKSEDWKIA